MVDVCRFSAWKHDYFFFLIRSSNYIYQPRGYAMLLIRTSILDWALLLIQSLYF